MDFRHLGWADNLSPCKPRFAPEVTTALDGRAVCSCSWACLCGVWTGKISIACG